MDAGLIAVILLGLVIGFIGGYAGIGGAPFMIAFLVLVLGMPQHTAQGTVLTMMLGPMSLMALLTMKEEVKHQWKHILVGIVSYAVFSYFGAVLAFRFSDEGLKKYFAVMLFLTALIQLLPFEQRGEPVKRIPLGWMTVTGALAGLVGGFFGVGAGVLFIPVFILLFNQHKNYARALSLGILLPPVSLGAFIKYYQMGAIHWLYVFVLFAGYFIANRYGAKFGNRAKPKTFKVVYSAILILLGVLYLV